MRRAAWRVDVLRAQMGVAVLGPAAVREVAGRLRDEPDGAFTAELL